MMYGCIGKTLKHSFSKEIHALIGLYGYSLTEIPEELLEAFMIKKDFCGINVTVPYKKSVIKYLDEVDSAVLLTGAVNTVVNKNGKLFGYNTDYGAFCSLLKRNEIEVKGKRVLVLGSGGTCGTVTAALKELQAGEIHTVSRYEKKDCITYEQAMRLKNTDIIVNTTPCGMYPDNGGIPIDISCFDRLDAVVDVVYNPIRTRLVCEAKAKGIKAAGGLYMLVNQAVRSAELFTGKTLSGSLENGIYSELLKKRNIVLTGMPGCGKSTVARQLSKLLKRPVFDTDIEVERVLKKSTADIIKEYGEEFFRKYEALQVEKAQTLSGYIISTGGGTVIPDENAVKLMQNGVFYFLDRPIEKLPIDKSRPLSGTAEKLERLYKERYPVYLRLADMVVENSASLQEAAKIIAEDFLNENNDCKRTEP